jgi:two-component system chemotaxis sensor kinase CheA
MDAATKSKSDEIKQIFLSSPEFCVLHVDDEQELRTIFAEYLEQWGIRTLSAADGPEALTLLKEHANHIVLIASDIKMPGMDGFELRSRIQANYAQIPFCILSAHVDREMALRGVELKIAAFLSKPLEPAALIQLLHSEALPKLASLKEDAELRQSFISDSESLIEESEDLLLHLEQDPHNTDPLNRFYAIMHTLKGSSAFFEPKDLHRFTHAYEDILKKLQRAELRLTPPVLTTLFRGFDLIKTLATEFKTGQHLPREFNALLVTLEISQELPTPALLARAPAAPASDNNLAARQPAPATPAVAATPGSDDIKVSVKLLDEFMQLSGEVTVIRNMLNKCVGAIEKRFAGDRDVAMLSELLFELHKINSGVQNKMTEIRKVPLKAVTRVLPRAVRDVAKSLTKKVDLVIRGDELRVDTSIAEVLSNSLLHIIKNSVDHGLEKPNERLASGKSETGLVEIAISVRDEKVLVKIADDGRGLNLEAIKAKLLKNGSHTKTQVDAMSAPELYAMIFSSGFSTAQQVTEISGRGVGMSMVKDCVDASGGKIVIQSTPGQGASFQLELPIPKSVLIANCLGIKIGSRWFALAQDDILRVLQFDTLQAAAQIRELEKSQFLVFDHDLIPIADLSTVLNLDRPSHPASETRRLVVMRSSQDNRRVALEVTEILDVEDMVIKRLHPTLNPTALYRGVTFTDDGSVGPVLNIHGIMDAINLRLGAKTTEPAKNQKSESPTAARGLAARQALTVSVNGIGVLALPQENVFRIEEVDPTEVKRSGSSLVVPYRGSILKIVPLRSLLDTSKTPITTPLRDVTAKPQVVIVQHAGASLGLEVDEVLDMVSYEELRTDLAQDRYSITGHIFVGTKTISILDVESILRRVAGIRLEPANPTPVVAKLPRKLGLAA